MATQHKVQTNKLQKKIGIQIEDGDKDSDQDANNKNFEKDDFDQDPMTLTILKKVLDFRVGQTLDDVKGNAQILSGIAVPPSTQQAIQVSYIYVLDLFATNQELDQKDFDKPK